MMRKFLLMISALVLVLSVFLSIHKQVDAALIGSNFNPNVNGDVLAIAIQSSGKILVGGTFTQVSSQSRNRLARLNPDGSLDVGFTTGISTTTNHSVRALVVDGNNKILVGGNFESLGGHTRWDIGRLNSDGTVDASFNHRTDGEVHAIALQPDGKILLGGSFTQILVGSTLYDRVHIARLNANGTMDTSFSISVSGAVNALAVQTDGKILLGGDFTTVAGQTREKIARLNSNGTLDTAFSASTNWSVKTIALQPDGRIMLGGNFSQVNSIGRTGVARLERDGRLDNTLNLTLSRSDVHTIALQPDGKILIGGWFSEVNEQARTMVARANFDGTLDANYRLSLGDSGEWVNAIALQPDGKIILGGTFTSADHTVYNRLVRCYPDGSRDTDASLSLDYKVNTVALQPDGKILIGGDFTTLNSLARQSIARLTPKLTIDQNFDAGPVIGTVNTIAVQPDGKILVGGNFSNLGATSRNNLGQLNIDGTISGGYALGTNAPVHTIALQPDGKVLIGGEFTTIGTTVRPYLARLNADGGLDASFTPGVEDVVQTIAIQADGNILIGGNFTYIGMYPRDRIARLLPNGELDTTFEAGAGATVRSIVVQPDGKILVAGDFISLNNTTTNRIGRLNANGTKDLSFFTSASNGANNTIYSVALQADGKIVVGGKFTQLNNAASLRLGRFHSDGGWDTSFLPQNTDEDVLALALQADGKIVAGGRFTVLNGVNRSYHGRLTTDEVTSQKLSVNEQGTLLVWEVAGPMPAFQRVTFELSTDGTNYTPMGNGSYSSSAWQLAIPKLPYGQNLFIRARGFFSSGLNNGSVSILEAVKNVYYPMYPSYLPLIQK